MKLLIKALTTIVVLVYNSNAGSRLSLMEAKVYYSVRRDG